MFRKTSHSLRRSRFNEAEARAPRMGRRDNSSSAAPRSFNEAEARAPRMVDARPHPVAGRAGFNEAEARAPRMDGGEAFYGTGRRTASMRPRRVRLGWIAYRSGTVTNTRGFNEAEARAPRMGVAFLVTLLAGHASMRLRRVRLGWSPVINSAPDCILLLQ